MNENKQKILNFIKENDKVSVKELTEVLPIGRIMIHRHLNNLIREGQIEKVGMPPKVYYSVNKERKPNKIIYNISPNIIKIIGDNFTLLKPEGIEIEGFDGFVEWCNDRKYKVKTMATQYVGLVKEYDNFKKEGFINATQKLTSTFNKESQFLDELYYLYPYSFPIFGKTKMGQWLFHAKQTQNKELMKRVINIVAPQIENLIKIKEIDSVAFVPPTLPRNIQFMSELQNYLKINLPIVKIEKVRTPILIQQKGLREISDRIKNAEETMVVKNRNTNYQKILLIDDFTGSGSTLNIIAGKIKKQKISNEVIGLTITGSMKGFEVIKEV